MSTKFVTTDVVKSIKEKFVKQWVSGTGKDTVFRENSEGWWITFSSCPASMYLGVLEPKLKEGDRVKITIERV